MENNFIKLEFNMEMSDARISKEVPIEEARSIRKYGQFC